MPKSKDLFDDSTMSFGDHLEALRIHLFKALIGLIVTVTITLFYSDRIIAVIRHPLDKAMKEYYHSLGEELSAEGEALEKKGFVQSLKDWWAGKEEQAAEEIPVEDGLPRDQIIIEIARDDLLRVVKVIDPDAKVNLDSPSTNPGEADETAVADARLKTVKLPIRSTAFKDFHQAFETVTKPITLNVQEPFMIYLKVALVGGLILAFPWIAYQLWLFVAAGLYIHEKRYVYVFLPISLGLFSTGAVFCYFGVFPFVLDFLLEFNRWLGVTPQIRLSEWISFALVLPLMFGLSFQLPLVMYFLDRMDLVSAQTFQDKRRLAILIIATLSMFLTPADPMSMIMMMVPLVILYELGIFFCKINPVKNPYELETP
ncbi:MAG TPA: twin-arginine translocase subunit TatC [Planctomycetaceae bacterium]|nr:twin-arginine translocase subunit TatC [Planctomycetaceae bacterium]